MRPAKSGLPNRVNRRRKPNTYYLRDEGRWVKLTKNERALLEVLRDPKAVHLPVAKIAELAGISRQTYYNAFQNPDFVAVVRQEVINKASARSLAVVETVLDKATDPEEKSHHWARMALELVGFVGPRQRQESSSPQIRIVFNVDRPGMDGEKVIEINPSEAPEARDLDDRG